MFGSDGLVGTMRRDSVLQGNSIAAFVGLVPLYTWDTGTEGDESDGRHCVFETDSATEMRRQVTDQGRQGADQQDRDDESHIAVGHFCAKKAALMFDGPILSYSVHKCTVIASFRACCQRLSTNHA